MALKRIERKFTEFLPLKLKNSKTIWVCQEYGGLFELKFISTKVTRNSKELNSIIRN